MTKAMQLPERNRIDFLYNFIRSPPDELYPEFHVKWFEIHTVTHS